MRKQLQENVLFKVLNFSRLKNPDLMNGPSVSGKGVHK